MPLSDDHLGRDGRVERGHGDLRGEIQRLRLTLFKGKLADGTTLIAKDGIVNINVSMEQFSFYVNELDTLIRVAKRSYPTMMIAGDFN